MSPGPLKLVAAWAVLAAHARAHARLANAERWLAGVRAWHVEAVLWSLDVFTDVLPAAREALAWARAVTPAGQPGESPPDATAAGSFSPTDHASIALAAAEVLDAAAVTLITLHGIVVDVLLGLPGDPASRPLSRGEWELLLAAGVDLPPWEAVERLRAAGCRLVGGST